MAPLTSGKRLLEMPGREAYLAMQRARMRDAIASLRKPVPENRIASALSIIEERSGLALSPPHFRHLLELYPVVRGLLASHDPENETDVADAILDMVADFFLGVRWPTHEEKVDLCAFGSLLRLQAAAMDFTVE